MKPIVLAFIAAALWGLWWIPIRWLEAVGFHGLWAGAIMNTGALLAAAVALIATRQRLEMSPRGMAGAALIGTAVTCFAASINYSDVARVILLFYLAPAWSKIIETLFMGVRWTWDATLALVVSFLGAALILGAGVETVALRPGDGLAILAGLSWSAGAALVFAGGPARVLPMVLVTCAASVAAVLVFLPFETAPTGDLAIGALGMVSGAAYLLPIMIVTLWAARQLAPATLSFLLTAEIVSGVASSALLLDEPFGGWQILGAVLIISGALIEVAGSLRREAT